MKKWFHKWGTLLITTILVILMAIVLILFTLSGNIALPGQSYTPPTTGPQVTQPAASTPGNNNYSPSTNNSSTNYISLGMFQNFGIVGDSYAIGTVFVLEEDGSIKSANYYEDLAWGNIMAKKLGTKCSNFSGGGLSTRNWLTSDKGLSALLAAEPQDIYYLMLGINDKETYGTENIGSLADIKDDFNQNADTFYGNYGKIICHIKQHAPEAKIIMSTMTGTSGTNKIYNEAIEEIAAYFGVPCVKQYEHPFFKSDFYLKNLVVSHPTAVVYSAMANVFEEMFKDAILNNMDYFKDYVG